MTSRLGPRSAPLSTLPGSPSPGLDFVDWCIERKALRPGGASFPRMGRFGPAPGLATSKQHGSTVLHVACGAGGLTKLLVSSGMVVSARRPHLSGSARTPSAACIHSRACMGAHTV
eukprot:364436-Chlamydomonas_euryale.AAC.5